jgi:hypothetical protein
MFRPELVELMPAEMGDDMLAHNLPSSTVRGVFRRLTISLS